MKDKGGEGAPKLDGMPLAKRKTSANPPANKSTKSGLKQGGRQKKHLYEDSKKGWISLIKE